MEIETEVTCGYLYYDMYVVAGFYFSFSGVQCSALLEKPTLRSKDSWLELIEAIKTRTLYDLDLVQGDGGIVCDGDDVIFYTTPSSGSDCNVKVLFKIPLDVYSDQCIKALNDVIEHPLMQKAWNNQY